MAESGSRHEDLNLSVGCTVLFALPFLIIGVAAAVAAIVRVAAYGRPVEVSVRARSWSDPRS